MQDPLVWGLPEQMLRQRLKSKYFGEGDPRSGGRGKWAREGKEANTDARYLSKQVTTVAAGDTQRQKRMYHRVFPIEEDGMFISQLLSITGAGEAAPEGH